MTLESHTYITKTHLRLLRIPANDNSVIVKKYQTVGFCLSRKQGQCFAYKHSTNIVRILWWKCIHVQPLGLSKDCHKQQVAMDCSLPSVWPKDWHRGAGLGIDNTWVGEQQGGNTHLQNTKTLGLENNKVETPIFKTPTFISMEYSTPADSML